MDEAVFMDHQRTCGKSTSLVPEVVPAPQFALRAGVSTYAIPWQHATSTTGQMPKAHHVCHQCQQKFGGKKAMRKHGTETGHQWQPSVRCSACLKAFYTRTEFKAHVPQVSCLDAPMISLLRSKSTVGVKLKSKEAQVPYFTGEPVPRSEGLVGSANLNHLNQNSSGTTSGSVFADVPSLSTHQQTSGRDNSVPQVVPAPEPDLVPESEAAPGLHAGSVLEAVVTSLCTAFSSVGSVSYTVESVGGFNTDLEENEDDTRPPSPDASLQAQANKEAPRPSASESCGDERDKILAHSESLPQPPTTAKTLSWHCRKCLRDPCVQPAVTACGHLFCQKCIVQTIDTHGMCPVCKRVILVKLDVAV
ncbi:hypothetical protein C8Q73DRAFT_220518 [Cubamyces lactineus]|nr:hypothetical protein C8Q73DRAFT_220518 [Cubamyces lactineus]